MSDFPELTGAITAADGPAAAAAFCRALAAGAPARELLGAAATAAAPLVNFPYHVFLDAEGRLVRQEVNQAYLGLGAAIALNQHLPPEQQGLPLVWAVHHLAAGCNEAPPAWAATATPVAGGLDDLVTAVLEGRPADAYSRWLAAAADPAQRDELRDRLRFCGAINLEESIDRQLRYLGHKAVCVENTLDLLDYLGWEAAPAAGLPGIACLATGPQLYPVYDLLWSRGLFPMAEVVAANSFDLSPEDQAALQRTILSGDREHVIQHLSDLINAGRCLAQTGSSVAVAAARLLLETSPGDWFVPAHGLIYATAVNRWVREGSSPLRVYGPCLAALLVNDIAHYYRTHDWAAEFDLSGYAGHDPATRALAAVDAGEMPAAASLAGEAPAERLLPGLLARAARWGGEVHALMLAAAVAGEHAQSSAAGKAVLLAALAKFLSTTDRDESIYRLYQESRGQAPA